MAILSQDQSILLIQSPANAEQLLKAATLELRVKLHTQAAMDAGLMQSKYSFFKAWVAKFLPPDKVEGFATLWQAPNETTELFESIFGELSRVWNSENPYTDHKFKTGADLQADFVEYLDSILDEKFWIEHYWEELKTDQNSILVVDLPAIQTTPKPAPYVYILDISCVIDASVNKDGLYDYVIAWTQTPGQIMVLDDVSWQLYVCEMNSENGTYDLSKVSLQSIVIHNLGRVPAKPLYFNPIDKHLGLVNHNPITRSLGRADWLLFFEIATKYLETYAPFPIYATYTEANDAMEVRQDKGEEYLIQGRDQMLAPGETITSVSNDSAARNFANRKLTGPGTLQRYDPPRDSSDFDMMANPVQVIPAEEISLNYCQIKLSALRDLIFSKCVGRGGDVINTQAANELQVQSTFESRINILSNIRSRIEESRKYIYELMGELRYGKGVFIGTDVSMGDVYYLVTVDDQQEQLTSAGAAGLPVYELQNQIQAIFRNKYRDQPQLLARNQILSELEPYPGQTITDVALLVTQGFASKEKLQIKIDFDGLIRRFEREQMNIVDFASAQPLATKIDTIYSQLQEYVKEQNTDDASQQVQGQQVPGAGQPGKGPLPPTPGKGEVAQGSEDEQTTTAPNPNS